MFTIVIQVTELRGEWDLLEQMLVDEGWQLAVETVRADRDQLFRVFSNLANNAAAAGAKPPRRCSGASDRTLRMKSRRTL